LPLINPAVLAFDGHGNVIGGQRTPVVDVPVSTLRSAAPWGTSEICSQFGQTTPFSQATLVSLYQNRSNYIGAYTASLDKAIHGGFILNADRARLLAQAQQIQLPS
jgi:hypothetical protein